MSEPSYSFSEFIELVLLRLYELDRSSPERFFDVSAIGKEIKGEVPRGWTIDAGKVLQSRGLAQCLFNSRGVFAQISGEGRLHVEAGNELTQRVKHERGNYFNINVSGGNAQVISSSQVGQILPNNANQVESQSDELVKEIKRELATDNTISEPEREEALRYISVVEAELPKREPNQNILAAMLQPLSQIVSIAGQVASLIKLVNG